METSLYLSKVSIYSKVDVRAKLLYSVFSSLAVFLTHSLISLTLYLVFIICLSLIATGFKETCKTFSRILFIVIFLILFSPLSERGGESLLKINGFLIITKESATKLYKVLIRFIYVSFIFTLLLETEREERIVKGLRFFGLPFSFSMVILLILRYIPYLSFKYQEIKESMSLREHEGKRGYPILPTITALTVSSILMIPKSASSLDERGFLLEHRTEYEPLNFSLTIFTEISLAFIIPLINIILARL